MDSEAHQQPKDTALMPCIDAVGEVPPVSFVGGVRWVGG